MFRNVLSSQSRRNTARIYLQCYRFAQTEASGSFAFDNSPILHVVKCKMDQRAQVEAQITDDMTQADTKRLMKALSETEQLSVAWKKWVETRQCLRDTDALLHDPDPSMRSMAEEEHTSLTSQLSDLVNTTFPHLLVPPSTTSHLSAMMELKAGVGGSESALFLSELMRMYLRLAQSKGWKASVIASNETENGGVKDSIMEIQGECAYDMLKWESGVHRVQRVPATESSGRVHTSTVAIVVLPLAEEDPRASEGDDELFKMDDVRIEVMRSRGAGGQHVNKTESAVRLTHVPTGITVSMQDERSQHQNKRRAFQVLRARLMDRKLSQQVVDRRDARRNLVRSADRSEKIRTYNFAQDRVTDHRIGLSLKNLESVLEGDALQDILDALAEKHRDDLLQDALEAPPLS
ncbi:peptide chain release factor 1 [Abortiporus biennis]|nr:peptide chain release factor 1 [Abortiporus biennis]